MITAIPVLMYYLVLPPGRCCSTCDENYRWRVIHELKSFSTCIFVAKSTQVFHYKLIRFCFWFSDNIYALPIDNSASNALLPTGKHRHCPNHSNRKFKNVSTCLGVQLRSRTFSRARGSTCLDSGEKSMKTKKQQLHKISSDEIPIVTNRTVGS